MNPKKPSIVTRKTILPSCGEPSNHCGPLVVVTTLVAFASSVGQGWSRVQNAAVPILDWQCVGLLLQTSTPAYLSRGSRVMGRVPNSSGTCSQTIGIARLLSSGQQTLAGSVHVVLRWSPHLFARPTAGCRSMNCLLTRVSCLSENTRRRREILGRVSSAQPSIFVLQGNQWRRVSSQNLSENF